jgi:hypothetical protein
MPQYGAPSALERRFHSLLEKRRQTSTLRTLTTATSHVDFSSNDFLSLTTNPALKSALLEELEASEWPTGSGGSRLLDGNSTYAENLEREICAFHGAEAGLLFNSGFDANAGFFACVPQKGDVVVYDELIHASVHDGMRLSRAEETVPFRHNCVEDLRRVLRAFKRSGTLGEDLLAADRHVFVAVEAVYSMDGDVAPLQAIVDTVEEVLGPDAGYVVIDEAHATGVLGREGRGLVCELGLEKRVFARLHTFGKALGCNGGETTPLYVSEREGMLTLCSNHSRIQCPATLPDQLRSPAHLYDLHVLHFACCHTHLLLVSLAGQDSSIGVKPAIADTHLVHAIRSGGNASFQVFAEHTASTARIAHLLHPACGAETPGEVLTRSWHDGQSRSAAYCPRRHVESASVSACWKYREQH